MPFSHPENGGKASSLRRKGLACSKRSAGVRHHHRYPSGQATESVFPRTALLFLLRGNRNNASPYWPNTSLRPGPAPSASQHSPVAPHCLKRVGPTFRTCPLQPRPGSQLTRLLLLHKCSAGGSHGASPCVKTRPVHSTAAQPLPSSLSARICWPFPLSRATARRAPRILCDKEWPLALAPRAVQVRGSPGTGSAVLTITEGFLSPSKSNLEEHQPLPVRASSSARAAVPHFANILYYWVAVHVSTSCVPRRKKKSHKKGLPQLWSEGALLAPSHPDSAQQGLCPTRGSDPLEASSVTCWRWCQLVKPPAGESLLVLSLRKCVTPRTA